MAAFTRDFFEEHSVQTAFATDPIAFGFDAEHILIVPENSGSNGEIDVSFDGTNVHDKVQYGTVFSAIEYHDRARHTVWLKSTAGDETVRVIAWRNHNRPLSDFNN